MRTKVLLLLLAALAACTDSETRSSGPASSALAVYTVNYPLRYFAERIGGDKVEVHFPAPPGEDPAYWDPGAEVIRRYQNADLILLNGAGYAAWVDRATLPFSVMVDTTASAKDHFIEVRGLTTHSHGPEGDHAHGGTASTTWLDPDMARVQAQSIASALEKLNPSGSAMFQQSLAELETDLDGLHSDLRAVTPGTPVVASHPVYQYLARAASLNLKSMHWEPDEMPSTEEWRKLDSLLSSHKAKLMIWEATPLPAVAAELGKRGVTVTVFRTCANAPEYGDYLQIMKRNVAALVAALR